MLLVLSEKLQVMFFKWNTNKEICPRKKYFNVVYYCYCVNFCNSQFFTLFLKPVLSVLAVSQTCLCHISHHFFMCLIFSLFTFFHRYHYYRPSMYLSVGIFFFLGILPKLFIAILHLKQESQLLGHILTCLFPKISLKSLNIPHKGLIW